MARLTATQKDLIANTKTPPWADRKKLTVEKMEDPTTGQMVDTVAFNQPLPQRLLRKDMRRIQAHAKLLHRVKWVKRGVTIEIQGGERADGTREKLYFEVMKSGTLIVRVHVDRRDGRKHICLNESTAVLAPDMELYRGFNETYWRDGNG